MPYRRARPLRTRRVYRRPLRRFVRPSMGNSKLRDHLAVYHNALSTATTNPKIPDGKCYNSVGLRLQSVKEFVNDGTGEMEFLFFPGLNNACIARSCVGTGVERLMPYTRHGTLDAGGEQEAGGEIARWRVVSQAYKVNLINNSDENDGWWEAIRVQAYNHGVLDDGWGLEAADGTAYVVGSQTPGELPGINTGIMSMVEHPTYVTGKLRDIHRHVFDLMPQGSDHDFNDIPYQIIGTGGLVDTKNYDCIYLRVHGRAGATTPTRLMIHAISNQEVLYQETSTMSRFHSEADNHAAIFQASKRKRQNGVHKAAKRQRVSLYGGSLVATS